VAGTTITTVGGAERQSGVGGGVTSGAVVVVEVEITEGLTTSPVYVVGLPGRAGSSS
jgi:hypothetical protein